VASPGYGLADRWLACCDPVDYEALTQALAHQALAET